MGGGNYRSNSKVKEPCKYFYLKIHISFFFKSEATSKSNNKNTNGSCKISLLIFKYNFFKK